MRYLLQFVNTVALGKHWMPKTFSITWSSDSGYAS